MELVVIGVILMIAACVQGSIGFGLGMLAAPLIALIRPDLLPALILLLALVLSSATLIRDRGGVEWRVVLWTSIGRLPGSLLGATAVAFLPLTGLSLALATAVILGIVSSLVGWRPGHGPRASLVAGAASGLLGTSTSIGGPPLSIILRDLAVEKIRGTMGAAFVIGSTLSITLLSLSGSLTFEHLKAAVLFLPAVVIGFLLSGVVNRHLNSQALYFGAVGLSLLGAVVVILRSLGQLL
ncbi:Sulfite exporter TauE/SafE [Corynebacterium occultum]|uniref:Probable membrane transporter protein n=1 Tax=Corynebacterium occultum TaxID=2675219 RepID=A0A6B8WIC4_9CORY|nr:sulfite exporter TauE/SafE family protein [Corynebacterium occultum]QGU06228.1 Sulfite exporter TauE/SafE [Corynebacterium occultum]